MSDERERFEKEYLKLAPHTESILYAELKERAWLVW